MVVFSLADLEASRGAIHKSPTPPLDPSSVPNTYARGIISKTMTRGVSGLKERMKVRPGQAVGVAAGVGVLFGFLVAGLALGMTGSSRKSRTHRDRR